MALPRFRLFDENGEPDSVTLQFLISYSKSYVDSEYVQIPDVDHKMVSREVLHQRVLTERQKMAEEVKKAVAERDEAVAKCIKLSERLSKLQKQITEEDTEEMEEESGHP